MREAAICWNESSKQILLQDSTFQINDIIYSSYKPWQQGPVPVFQVLKIQLRMVCEPKFPQLAHDLT